MGVSEAPDFVLGPPRRPSPSLTGDRIGGATTPWRRLAPMLIFAAVVIASRAIWFGGPAAGSDNQVYSLIGAAILDGALP